MTFIHTLYMAVRLFYILLWDIFLDLASISNTKYDIQFGYGDTRRVDNWPEKLFSVLLRRHMYIVHTSTSDLSFTWQCFLHSALPEVPEPFVLHPNVLQHTINHPLVFDNGAEPTFMAPAKVRNFEMKNVNLFVLPSSSVKLKLLSILIFTSKRLKCHLITAKLCHYPGPTMPPRACQPILRLLRACEKRVFSDKF